MTMPPRSVREVSAGGRVGRYGCASWAGRPAADRPRNRQSLPYLPAASALTAGENRLAAGVEPGRTEGEKRGREVLTRGGQLDLRAGQGSPSGSHSEGRPIALPAKVKLDDVPE